MAQSRLQKFASIFNRVEGFLKSGVIKPEDKPIWFDVYKQFPPVVEPVYLRPLPEVQVKPIFYYEDRIRAEFYRVFGSPGLIDLVDSSKTPISELFIEKCIEVAKSTETDIDDVMLFNLTANRLREAGYQLRKYPGFDNIDLPQLSSSKPSSQKTTVKPRNSLDIKNLMVDD